MKLRGEVTTVVTLARTAIGELDEHNKSTEKPIHTDTLEENYESMVIELDSKIAELKLLLQSTDYMTEGKYGIASEVVDELVKLLNRELKNTCKKIRGKVPDYQPWMLDVLKKEYKQLFEARVPKIQRMVQDQIWKQQQVSGALNTILHQILESKGRETNPTARETNFFQKQQVGYYMDPKQMGLVVCFPQCTRREKDRRSQDN